MLTMYKVRFGPDSIESENLSEIRQNLTTNLAVTDPAQSPDRWAVVSISTKTGFAPRVNINLVTFGWIMKRSMTLCV